MIETIATVASNEELVPGYRLLVANFSQIIEPQPGQFAMIRAHGVFEPLLRRALAVYRVEAPCELSFLYQVLGRGTQALSRLCRNDRIEVLAPLGNCWPVDEISESGKKVIIVSGGIGSASLLMLCSALERRGADSTLLFGAASKQTALGCGLADFEKLGVPVTITTDDGSLGESGLVTAPLERLLKAQDKNLVVCACGPWPMMARVAEIAEKFGVTCLVSLEAPMGCGFGVCVGCVVAVQGESSNDFDRYKRVCVDGSIFKASEVRWDVNAMGH